MSSRTTAYTEDQFSTLYPPGFELYFWNRFRAGKIRKLLKKLDAKKVLDVGCGSGHIVKNLREHDIDAYGCELSASSKACSPEIAPYVMMGCDAVDVPAEIRENVDAIMLLDVLEHIEKPVDFLNKLTSSFPNLQKILITVPAFMELWSPISDEGHFRRYTRESLAEELNRCANLEILRHGYFFHSLYPVKRLTRNTEDKATHRISPVEGLFARTVHFMACAYFMVEDLLPGSVPGSSLYCTVKVRGDK